SADGKWLVSLSRDRTCRVWDAQSGRLHCTIAEKDVDFYAVAFSADSTTLAVAGGDPFHGGNTGIRLFDVATGERTGRLLGHEQPAYALGFSPDGKTLLSISCDQVIRFDLAGGSKLWQWKLRSTAAVALSPDRATVASVDGETADGKTLALAGLDAQVIHRWDVATATALPTGPGHPGQIYSIAFSPDARLVATAGGDWHDDDRHIYLWNALTGKVVRRLEGHAGKVYCVQLSPDGKTLVSGSEKEDVFRLWDVATGTQWADFKRKPVNGGVGRALPGDAEARV